jgi:dipeptidyl aminopeptidase/acylaminoacyl peptidase
MKLLQVATAVFLLIVLPDVAQSFAQETGKPPANAFVVVARRPLQLSPAVAQSSAELLKRVHMEAITYMSDGLRIQGYLAVPDGPGPFPCVIVNRGGNPNLGVWTDESAWKSLSRFAAWGYVAVASQYRGAGGSEGKDEYGAGDVDDVLNLLPVLHKVSGADMSRIGMFGASRGGMMTYLALTRTDKIRAAVVLSGMSDLKESMNARPEMERVFHNLIPDFERNKDAAIKQRSAIAWPDKLPANVPLMLIHGTADWRVSPVQAFDMARALMDAKHPVRFVMFEGGSHGVPEFAAERDELMHEWLDAYVRDGKKWPDLKPHGD